MEKTIKLTADELAVIELALELLDPVRILLWEIDGYGKKEEKDQYLEALLEKVGRA